MVWAIVERFIGVIFLLVVLPDYLKERHLTRNGVRTRAEVGEMYERVYFWRSGIVRKYDLTFTTADGTRITTCHEPGRVLEGGWEPIVYDPKHPQDLVLASDLPPKLTYVYIGIACTVFFAIFPLSVLSTLS